MKLEEIKSRVWHKLINEGQELDFQYLDGRIVDFIIEKTYKEIKNETMHKM